jgi:hypothetical protein
MGIFCAAWKNLETAQMKGEWTLAGTILEAPSFAQHDNIILKHTHALLDDHHFC